MYKNGGVTPYVTGSGTTFTFTPNEIADYTIALTASDEDGGSATTTSTISVTSIGGTAGNDVITINSGTSLGTLKVTVNGATQDNVPFGGVVQVYGQGGNDSITINATLSGGITVDGGEGGDAYTVNAGNLLGPVTVNDSGASTDSDSLTMNGTAGNDTISKTLTQVTVGNTTTVNYAGVEQFTLDGKAGGDTYTVDFGGTAQTTTAVADSGPAGDLDYLTVNGTSSNDFLFKNTGFVEWKPLGASAYVQRVDFSNMDLTILRAGAGNDTIHDPGTDTQIFGGSGDDTIIIDATSGNGVTLNGEEGSDSYIIDLGSLAGPVTIADSGTTGSNSVTVVGTDGPDAVTLEIRCRATARPSCWRRRSPASPSMPAPATTKSRSPASRPPWPASRWTAAPAATPSRWSMSERRR